MTRLRTGHAQTVALRSSTVGVFTAAFQSIAVRNAMRKYSVSATRMMSKSDCAYCNGRLHPDRIYHYYEYSFCSSDYVKNFMGDI